MKNKIHGWIKVVQPIVNQYKDKDDATKKKFMTIVRNLPTSLRKLGIMNAYLVLISDKDATAKGVAGLLHEEIKKHDSSVESTPESMIKFFDAASADSYYLILEDLLGFARELKLYAEAVIKLPK